MEIRKATLSDLESIYQFNKEQFPEKRVEIKDYIDFWIAKSTSAIDDVILLVDETDKIVGQNILSEMSYYYKDEVRTTVWGFDLIVEKEYRKDSWGLELMLFSKSSNPGLMATGSGPLALAINLKMGMKWLGEIRKYVCIVSPQNLLFSIFRGNVSINNFPSSVSLNDIKFNRISKDELPDIQKTFNNNLLEISRDKEFLKWRFYSSLHDYAVYIDAKSESYFVLRTIIQKHITALLLVDYRCDVNKPEQFQNIISVVKRIARKLHLSIIITGSTLRDFDNILEEEHFKSVGRPRPVLGYLKCKDRKKDIDDRNFCFVTLADSDGETNWV